MTIISTIETGRCDARMEALRTEFGSVLAERIFEAEAADFLWEARVRERYLGQQIDILSDDEDWSQDVSRIAFLSLLEGRWHAGMCLVNGEGSVIDLCWDRPFAGRGEAEFAFQKAR